MAWVIARRIDADFYWLNIEDPHDPRGPGEQRILDRVAPTHLFKLLPTDLTPHPELGNLAEWLVRGDVSSEKRLRTLAEYMRLPELARHVLTVRDNSGVTGALVVANSDRTRPLYSSEEGGIRPLIEAVNVFNVTILFVVMGEPRPNSRDVDYLLSLEREGLSSHGKVWVTCSQGAPMGGPGLFHAGRREGLDQPLTELESRRPL